MTGVAVETIRHYEREGLMPATARSAGNYRVYGQTHVQQLSLIRHCRGMDMSLGEIRTLLRYCTGPMQDCGEVAALLDAHLEHVGARMRELRALEKQLKGLRKLCSGEHGADSCGILCQLNAGAAQAAKTTKSRGHVRATHL